VPDTLTMERIGMVSKRTGLSKTQIYLQVSQGHFPRPVKIGAHNYWVVEQIDHWVALRGGTGCGVFLQREPKESDTASDGPLRLSSSQHRAAPTEGPGTRTRPAGMRGCWLQQSYFTGRSSQTPRLGRPSPPPMMTAPHVPSSLPCGSTCFR
jgi:Predicted transcriptional regulator